MASKRAHALISGKVQGVWYRDATQKEAERQGVTGWVRNLDDGRVEAVFEGESSAVDAMVAWCNEGPPNARVADVQAEEGDARGEFDDFRITG